MKIVSKLNAAVCAATLLAAVAGSVAVAPQQAYAAGPELVIRTQGADSAEPGEAVQLALVVENAGTSPTAGPLTIAYTTASGIAAAKPSGLFDLFRDSVTEYTSEKEEYGQEPSCETIGREFRCIVPEVDPLPPGAAMVFDLEVETEVTATGVLTNTVTAVGGGAAEAVTQQQLAIGEPGAFAFDRLSAEFDGWQPRESLQAGSDPTDFTTTLDFKTTQGKFLGFVPVTAAVQHFKTVLVHLPAGLVGNLSATTRCTGEQLSRPGERHGYEPQCPLDSLIGLVHVAVSGTPGVVKGLYNMLPPPGAAGEFGFIVEGVVIELEARVRPDDGGIDILSRNTSTTVPITGVEVTVWGNPAAHVHDRVRGGGCLELIGANGQLCESSAHEQAFLRLPTSCSNAGGIPFSAESNSYEEPSKEVAASFSGPVMTGCSRVPFDPTIDVQPTSASASSVAGVSVKLALPQTVNPEGVWEADLKKAVVTLPEGLTINPSAADGLMACSDAQFGVGLEGPSQCPDAAKIGYLDVKTPLLSEPVEGSIWLLDQNSSDPASGEMFRIGLELQNQARGIDIKVPGHISANPVTGQLTTTFDDAPQEPFESLTLHFKAGARSPLSTPSTCGVKTTVAKLYSWSQPDVAVQTKVPFEITSGPEGSPCVTPRPFTPGFDAGVKSVQAASFTPFLATFSRKDSDQEMQRVSVRMPEGLLGSLVGLPLCGETQANAGTCSPASEIGSVTAGAGAGPTPFYVTGGKVYMTGPYEGAPFGLSVVVPTKAGPFDLGNVVVRAKVEVDVHTAQLTVTTDSLPQIVSGVPVNLRLVNVTIDRPDFTYNPTDCDPKSVTGAVTGAQGGVAHLENRFQVTNCGALKFQPKFTVKTNGKTSRSSGASIDAKLVYPKTPQGTEANIAKVKVSLPKQLPSRLTTLQKACTAATFEANPASCPAASRIGTATAHTPVLPVPLTGPVYFVSHGGEAFPDLVVVLQGYGVTVELVGTTFINDKTSITSTTFKQVPDVPVGSFEIKLPQGPNSALAAIGDLCKGKLKMPTAFVAQDGAEIHTATPIVATGCAKHKSKLRHRVKGKKK
jgi:hypothetical protein